MCVTYDGKRDFCLLIEWRVRARALASRYAMRVRIWCTTDWTDELTVNGEQMSFCD